jgi:hypothetical protein
LFSTALWKSCGKTCGKLALPVENSGRLAKSASFPQANFVKKAAICGNVENFL